MSMRVILVRHGQSSYNKERRIQGRLDHSVLTDAGSISARQVGAALKGLHFQAVYSSPLQRARQTAEVILSCFDHPPTCQNSEYLREIDLPLWEGMLRQDVITKFSDDYHLWQTNPEKFSMVMSDAKGLRKHYPVLAIFEQAKLFWDDLLARHSDGNILVIAHNGINRALLGTAIGIGPAYYQSIQQSNCGVSVLNFGNKNFQLESMNLTSHVGEKFPKPREGHKGVRLLLVRHGETDWNRQGRFQGQIDVPLNDNGKNQSNLAAEFLQSVNLDFAVTSPMLRPKETAENILRYHPNINLQLSPDLREISHGLWEGKYESEIEGSFPGMLESWRSYPETVQMPEGENLKDVWGRVGVAWEEIVRSNSGTGIVVGHDATNKAILCQLFGLSIENFWKFKQGNCAVSVIDYPHGIEGKPVLQAMNITSHLSGGEILDCTAAGAL